uniref:Brinker DNA-binding domain-containing protein n=1 Tax=Acrobeloides nanus TaxID=290746 RepID=A0A914DF49_9BILA
MNTDNNNEVLELQLNEEEGLPVNCKCHRNNDAATKLEAIKWARQNSIESAAKKFKVDRSCIKEWIKQSEDLKRQMKEKAGYKRKSLDEEVARSMARSR